MAADDALLASVDHEWLRWRPDPARLVNGLLDEAAIASGQDRHAPLVAGLVVWTVVRASAGRRFELSAPCDVVRESRRRDHAPGAAAFWGAYRWRDEVRIVVVVRGQWWWRRLPLSRLAADRAPTGWVDATPVPDPHGRVLIDTHSYALLRSPPPRSRDRLCSRDGRVGPEVHVTRQLALELTGRLEPLSHEVRGAMVEDLERGVPRTWLGDR